MELGQKTNGEYSVSRSRVTNHKRKKKTLLPRDDHSASSDSSSSSFEYKFSPFELLYKKICELSQNSIEVNSKRDYLIRLFEKQKLKEKSISKRVRTPFDRKLNRTCWPVHIGKLTKIKKKPVEKRKQKPDHKSLRKKKFSNPSFAKKREEKRKRKYSESEIDSLEDRSFDRLIYSLNPKYFPEEQVTPSDENGRSTRPKTFQAQRDCQAETACS